MFISTPAIQMGCPEGLTGKVMSLALSCSPCAQPHGQITYGLAHSVLTAGVVLFATFTLALLCAVPVAHVADRFEA